MRAATKGRQRCTAKEACKEAEGELRSDIRRETRSHDPGHEEHERREIDWVATECFGEGTTNEGADAEGDEVEGRGEGLRDFTDLA